MRSLVALSAGLAVAVLPPFALAHHHEEQADWFAEPFGLILITLLFLVLIALSLAVAVTRRTKPLLSKPLVSATTPTSGKVDP